MTNQQCGIEWSAVADGDLLCAVEADGDRLSGLDRTTPAAAGECVAEGAITQVCRGDVGPPGLTVDGVRTDEAPGPVVQPRLGRVGEGDLSGEAVPPEIAVDLNVEAVVVWLRLGSGRRRRLWFW